MDLSLLLRVNKDGVLCALPESEKPYLHEQAIFFADAVEIIGMVGNKVWNQ